MSRIFGTMKRCAVAAFNQRICMGVAVLAIVLICTSCTVHHRLFPPKNEVLTCCDLCELTGVAKVAGRSGRYKAAGVSVDKLRVGISIETCEKAGDVLLCSGVTRFGFSPRGNVPIVVALRKGNQFIVKDTIAVSDSAGWVSFKVPLQQHVFVIAVDDRAKTAFAHRMVCKTIYCE